MLSRCDALAYELDLVDAELEHLGFESFCGATDDTQNVETYDGTVDNVIVAIEANHPQLTTAKAFYVEISRARDKAKLVTDDARALKGRLETVTGERISALEGIGETVRPEREKDGKALPGLERSDPEVSTPPLPERKIEPEVSPDRAPESGPPAREK